MKQNETKNSKLVFFFLELKPFGNIRLINRLRGAIIFAKLRDNWQILDHSEGPPLVCLKLLDEDNNAEHD